MTERGDEHFRYGISQRTLSIGIACLASILVLLLAVAVPSSALWWTLTGFIALCLALSVYVALATRRVQPIQVVLRSDELVLPSGAVGTRSEHIPYADIHGIRIVGRAAIGRKERTREVTYLLFGTRYSLLISEMFEGWHQYARCRDVLLERVRAARPDVRVDIDGVIQETPGAASDPSESPST